MDIQYIISRMIFFPVWYMLNPTERYQSVIMFAWNHMYEVAHA